MVKTAEQEQWLGQFEHLPHNQEAEQALLAALLHNNNIFEDISQFLEVKHFADATHGKVFEAIGVLLNKGKVVDPITLGHYFEQEEELEKIGGREYIVQLAQCFVSIINAREYARLIRDLYLRRELIDLGQDVVNEAKKFELELTVEDQIVKAENQLYDLATVGQLDRGFASFNKALEQAIEVAQSAFKRSSHVVGVTSGFVDIDKKLGGFHSSDLLILAGRPSMGKTALATNIAFNAAKYILQEEKGEGSVAFFSLEMSSEQLASRLLAQEVGISSDRIRRGEISQQDFPKFLKINNRLEKLPLYIDDTPGLTVASLRTRARRLKRQRGLKLIVIDYLQLLQKASGSRYDNRVQEISEITRELKNLAKELSVPVLALSQLSRAVEQRDDKRPQLADLRESGSIEQDADVVMFIYRAEYYLSRQKPAEEDTEKYSKWQEKMAKVHNCSEVIVAKQRHGPIGSTELFFDSALTKFSNIQQ